MQSRSGHQVLHIHVAAEGARRASAKLAQSFSLHADDAAKGIQVQSEPWHGARLRLTQFPDLQKDFVELGIQQAQTRNDARPCPMFVLVIDDIYLEAIALARSSYLNRPSETMNPHLVGFFPISRCRLLR